MSDQTARRENAGLAINSLRRAYTKSQIPLRYPAIASWFASTS